MRHETVSSIRGRHVHPEDLHPSRHEEGCRVLGQHRMTQVVVTTPVPVPSGGQQKDRRQVLRPRPQCLTQHLLVDQLFRREVRELDDDGVPHEFLRRHLIDGASTVDDVRRGVHMRPRMGTEVQGAYRTAVSLDRQHLINLHLRITRIDRHVSGQRVREVGERGASPAVHGRERTGVVAA